MAFAALNGIAAPLRAYGPVVFEGCEDPHAELMALVWGPHFDREHARHLLDQHPGYIPQVVQAVERSAEQFDSLPEAHRHRLRQLIVRHRSQMGVRPHPLW